MSTPEPPKIPFPIPKGMDPYKTILVVKHKGKEVGRIPAMASNVNDYLSNMAMLYKGGTVEYEKDPTDGLLYALHGGH